MGIDPGNRTGFAVTTWFDIAPQAPTDPTSFERRKAWWQRTKERLDERKRERAEQEARENMDISKWLAEKAPTRGELIAQSTLDRILEYMPEDRMPNPHRRHVHIGADGTVYESELDFMRFAMLPSFPMPDIDIETGFDENARVAVRNLLERRYGTHPISSARRTPTRDAVLEKIRRNTVDVEPVMDVAEMIVAHRNGATALERPMTIDEKVESPVWEELVERMWDPTHERGPRERDWLHAQHKRQQPKNTTRSERRGKR